KKRTPRLQQAFDRQRPATARANSRRIKRHLARACNRTPVAEPEQATVKLPGREIPGCRLTLGYSRIDSRLLGTSPPARWLLERPWRSPLNSRWKQMEQLQNSSLSKAL